MKIYYRKEIVDLIDEWIQENEGAVININNEEELLDNLKYKF
jgi:hypothetical protein